MKAYTGSLATFLVNAKSFVYADLYSIVLNGGGVIRWTNAEITLNVAGYTFVAGPPVDDAGTKTSRGVVVDTLDLTFYDAEGTTTINGSPLVKFARNAGFDNASIGITRVFYSDWLSTGTVQGTFVRFSGRISEVKDITRTQVTLSCSSWMELLNVKMPANLYQSSCLNNLYGSACGISKAGYAASGVVGTGTNTASVFSSNLATTAGYYSLGFVVFTSGVNSGIQRTIKSSDASGNLTLVVPLLGAPAHSDTFTAYPGCDLSQGTCSTKFSNLTNYRGFPYVPPPELSL